jgi:hypothetical protein
MVESGFGDESKQYGGAIDRLEDSLSKIGDNSLSDIESGILSVESNIPVQYHRCILAVPCFEARSDHAKTPRQWHASTARVTHTI